MVFFYAKCLSLWKVYFMAKKFKTLNESNRKEESPNIAKEAAHAYHTSYSNLSVVLGGTHSVNSSISDIDLIRLSRAGIKKRTLKYLAVYLGITLEQLGNLLHTSYRNLQRKDENELLDSYKSEKVLELSSLVTRGVEVIGNDADFKEWLHSSILALGNRKPIDFLDTSFGIQMVLKVLGRLEMGVYS